MRRIGNHLMHFWPVYIIVFVLLCAAFLASKGEWEIAHVLSIVSLLLFCFCLLTMPMNIIYGFIGTSGSIPVFLFLLLIFNLAFSGIYYKGFFQNAGITYDLNQPYVSFNLFFNKDTTSIQDVESFDTTFIYAIISSPNNYGNGITNIIPIDCTGASKSKLCYSDSPIQISISKKIRRYQRIGFNTVFQNTLLTSLIQEPTDLFAIASSYNEIETGGIAANSGTIEKWEHDRDVSRIFNWILILQVFISWIFFGVFISILYNKFRYES